MQLDKTLEQLTAREKYELLIWADQDSSRTFLCDRIAYSIDKNLTMLDYEIEDIQNNFDMLQFKPKERGEFWWVPGDPAREIAWNLLLEYWKNKANEETD